jgi:hypothetical protein
MSTPRLFDGQTQTTQQTLPTMYDLPSESSGTHEYLKRSFTSSLAGRRQGVWGQAAAPNGEREGQRP